MILPSIVLAKKLQSRCIFYPAFANLTRMIIIVLVKMPRSLWRLLTPLVFFSVFSVGREKIWIRFFFFSLLHRLFPSAFVLNTMVILFTLQSVQNVWR